MSYQTILVDVSDQVATVTLNRPERRNAWTRTMELELSTALVACDRDDGIRVVILTGSGKYFSVGADLDDPSIPANAGTAASSAVPVPDAPLTLPRALRKPVIAAIQGDAIGAGSTYPLGCDIRIVADTARLGFVFAKRGLIPGYGSMWALPRIIGLSAALELVLTGRLFTGVEAATIGLAHRSVPAAAVVTEARAIATGIATECGPVSTALIKRMLWAGGALDPARFAEMETSAIAWSAAGSESTEGIAAFLEKRPPAWSMSPTDDLPPWYDAGVGSGRSDEPDGS